MLRHQRKNWHQLFETCEPEVRRQKKFNNIYCAHLYYSWYSLVRRASSAVLFLAKMKRKLVVFEVLGLIFATFYQEKVGSTPDLEESMQPSIANN
ncbi:MAG: hypothetical protein ACJAZ2_001536 [Glaciecola sp.]|jgi:hypothetical protein